MASATEKLLQYKFDSAFYEDGDIVVNKTFASTVPVFYTWSTDEKLGAGAFGVVWRQKEITTGDLRAVKTISKLQLNVRELEALVELQDRSDLFIILFGWYEDPHATYIAMEYIPNGDLGRYIKENRAKAKADGRAITEQILRGRPRSIAREGDLPSRSKAAGNVPFDCQPPRTIIPIISKNILIASVSPIHVKITDFGISKRAIDTSLRTNCGTTAYRAPELLGLLPKNLKPGRSYSNAVDLWALGVVVHEILTSEIPFLDPDRDTIMTMTDQSTTSDDTPEVDMELLFQYCRDSTLFPAEPLHTNGTSDLWQDLVRSLMAVDPRDRPSAADALNSRCLTEYDLELLASQFGQLLSVNLRPAAITVLLECELGVFIALLHSFGGTTIHELHRRAADMGFLEVVSLVGSKPYAAGFGGDLSSLQLPSWYGQIDMIKVMVDCGLVLKARNAVSCSQQALQKAAADGYLDVVKLLIAQGADVKAGSGSFGSLTPLQGAAQSGQVDVVRLLVASGADVDVELENNGKPRPLKVAAQNGHVDVVQLLIAEGADVNAVSGWVGSVRALQAAAEHGQVDVLQLLLAHGADPNLSSGYLGSLAPLQAATEKGHVDGMTVLLSHGANVDAIYNGRAALHLAAKKGQVDAIRVLLAHGADVNANHLGWTALHDAAEKGHVDVIKLLLAHGADFDEEDKGWPALQTAVVHGQLGAVRVLLAHGAEAGGEGTGGTTLHEAVGHEYDPASVNFHRRTRPFPIYSGRGHGGLMDRMRDVHTGRKRWTPLQLAIKNRHSDAIRVLLAHGLGIVSQTRPTA